MKRYNYSPIITILMVVFYACASPSFAAAPSSANYIMLSDSIYGSMGQATSAGESSSSSYTSLAGTTDVISAGPAQSTQFTLTVSTTGTGSGTVTSSPEGIDCGSDCTALFSDGTEITLTAVEDTGSKFIGWTGCNSSTGNICKVTMDADKKVSALFGLTMGSQYSIMLSKAGTGSGTVTLKDSGEVDCGTDCTETGAVYNAGTKVTLKAVPSKGSSFAGWTGNACNESKKPTCVVTMSADIKLTATFNMIPLNQYTFSFSKSGNGTVNISTEDKQTDCGADCDQVKNVYDAGTKITLTAVADPGYAFAVWYGDACNGKKSSICTIKIKKDTNVVANFKISPIIKLKKTGAGSGTVTSSPAGISCGADCTDQQYSPPLWKSIQLKAVPDTGSKFNGWTGDICNGSKNKVCKISKILNDKELTASFGRPFISLSSQNLSFESPTIGSYSSQALTITNIGDAALVIKQMKVTSLVSAKEAGMFKIYTNTIPEKAVSKATIPAGGTLELTIKYKPTTEGEKIAALTITSDAPDAPVLEVALNGAAPSPCLSKHFSTGFEDYVTREEMAMAAVCSQLYSTGTLLSDNYCEDGSPFADISPNRLSCKYIKKLYELGTKGCDETAFCPEDYITREEAAYLIISSSLSETVNKVPDSYCDTGTPFIDVPADRWSCKYIKRLYELGLTAEKDGQMFRPDDFVRKKEFEELMGAKQDN